MSHLLWDGVYLGTWDGSNWDGPELRNDETWAAPIGETFFGIDSGDSFVATELGDPCASIDSPVGGAAISELSWDAYPRRSLAISPALAHSESLRGLLIADGLSDPEEGIQTVTRVDLEGDGTDEVIIEAVNEAGQPYFASPVGAYSAVVLRRNVGQSATDIPIFLVSTSQAEADEAGVSDIDSTLVDVPIVVAKIGDVLDLNGDGSLELIIHLRGDHAAQYLVFDATQGFEEPVLSVSCGW